jgi:plasmid stabilization system protein ParE
MSLTVRILPRAEHDVRHIFDFIADKSPDGALRWWDVFQKSAANLAINPTSYTLAPESGIGGYELRQFLFKTRRGRTYRGIFTVVGSEIRILRVRGPGQAPLEADELA